MVRTFTRAAVPPSSSLVSLDAYCEDNGVPPITLDAAGEEVPGEKMDEEDELSRRKKGRLVASYSSPRVQGMQCRFSNFLVPTVVPPLLLLLLPQSLLPMLAPRSTPVPLPWPLFPESKVLRVCTDDPCPKESPSA